MVNLLLCLDMTGYKNILKKLKKGMTGYMKFLFIAIYCICFLWLLQQIAIKVVALNHRNLLTYVS